MPTATIPDKGEIARANLRLANDVRSRRAKLKRDLAAGRAKLVPVLLNPPPYAAAAKVHELLRAVPGIGEKKADKLMRRVVPTATHSKTVAGLSDRQRVELVRELR